MTPRRRGAALAALAAAGALTGTPVAFAADPALAALAARDAYLSPTVTRDPGALARLGAAAAARRRSGEPIKLAVVTGPAGAPSLAVYARRLRRELRFVGPVIVSAPGRPVAVAAPGPPGPVTRALRRERVGRVADPVARAIAAVDALAPPAPARDRGDALRATLGLIGLALIGGLWAVAVGLRRQRAAERHRLHQARGTVAGALEDLRRRIERLDGDHPGAAGADVTRAAAGYAAGREALEQARDLPAVARAAEHVRHGLEAVEDAGGTPAGPVHARLASLAGVAGVADAGPIE